MAICREKGIVIQSRDIGDSDRVVCLAGENYPKMFYLFKGIRKSKRRPISASELGSLIEIDFYNQPNKEWKSVKEFQLLNRFENLKSDYLKTNFLLYITEFFSSIYPEGESHPFLLQLLLGSLEHSENQGFAFEILPFFKIRALTHMGHFPSEFHCFTCGEEILKKEKAFFAIDAREFLCGDCHSFPKDHLPVLQLFSMMLTRKFSKLNNLNSETVFESDQMLNQLIRSILGRELKTYFEFYKSMGRI